MTVLFETEDLENLLQRQCNTATVELLRSFVTAMIKSLGLDYSASGAVVPDDVRGVALTSTARGYVNPTGATSESVGPYAVRNGTVYLTAEEVATLEAVKASTSTLTTPFGVGSIAVTPGLAGCPRQLPDIRTPVPGTLGHPEW